MTRAERNKLKKTLHQAVVARYGNKCLRCKTTKTITASHIYPRGVYRSLEWDIDNVKPLCWNCHLNFWHKNPMEAMEWLNKALPKEHLRRLRRKVLDTFKTKLKPYYKYDEIKKQLDEIIYEPKAINKKTKRNI